VSKCTCGGHDAANERVRELIVDAALFRRYDMLPISGYATLDSVDWSKTFEKTCDLMLEHIQCPIEYRCNRGNVESGNYSTWEGSCLCSNRNCYREADDDFFAGTTPELTHYFPVDFSTRIAEDAFDAILKPSVVPLLVRPNKSQAVWDMCSSYLNLCQFFLDKIDCPVEIRRIQTCGGATPDYPNGVIQNMTEPMCECASMNALNERGFETVIDAVTFQLLNEKYLYLPPPNAAFTLLVRSSPFKQLSQPDKTIPSQ
jgi:hypothetical protein